MFDFSELPLTPDQARAARNYCGMTQAQAATASSLPAYKIKRFELGTTIPDTEFLDGLRSFYESKGYEFPDTAKPGEKAKSKGTVFPGGVVNGGDDDEQDPVPPRKVKKSTVQHIRIASSLSDEEIGSILEHIEANEEQVEELLQAKVEAGLMGGLSDKSEAQHGQMLRLLSENGTLWAKLVGRTLITPPADGKISAGTPKTQADLLAKTQAHVHSAVAGDKAAATAKRKAHKPANPLTAIFG
jgi:transcriptional regulator with XRE-family HTH domain